MKVFTTAILLEEIEDVLSRKKISSKLTFPLEKYLEFHLEHTIFIEIKEIFKGCPDVKDDYLFDLAIHSDTKTLVTGDKKLLTFENNEVTIISLAEFLQRFK